MAVKIRLARRGRKKRPIYSIVVADSRAPRDGRFIEKLGVFNPNVHNTTQVTLNNDRALYWVLQGAQPSDTCRTLLSKEGVMFRKHLQVGVNKGAITQETADQRYQEWIDSKLAKDQAFVDAQAKAKADEEAKIAAEIKKIREDEAKAEEEAKAKAVAEAAAAAKAEEEAKAAAEAEAAAAEAPAEEEAAPAEEAAPVAEAAAEETPAPEAPAEDAAEEKKED